MGVLDKPWQLVEPGTALLICPVCGAAVPAIDHWTEGHRLFHRNTPARVPFLLPGFGDEGVG